MDNSNMRIIDKKLNGHQIDVIRRAILNLIALYGKARLVILASYLLKMGETGFTKGVWCGYRKLRPMIEAYPEFFKIRNAESTDPEVCIVNRQNAGTYQESVPTVDMDFDHFVYNHISPELAEEVCRELNLKDGLEDYCVFCNYLRYTYHKAIADGKVLEYANLRMFHTGWLHNDTDDIYMLWGYNQDGSIQNCFTRRSSRDARMLIRYFGSRMPELVEYPIIQFDTKLHIEPEFGHIIDERGDRIPNEIIDMLRLNPELRNYSGELSNQEIVRLCRNFLRRLITGCIMDSKSRLANRRDEAVQFWNKRTNKMCWLIPLRLGLTEKVNLTLVLDKGMLNDNEVYRAHTILPLKEAFKCARLLGPVRAEWLRDSWKNYND